MKLGVRSDQLSEQRVIASIESLVDAARYLDVLPRHRPPSIPQPGGAREVLRDLPCTTIQCDEIWSFCYSKQKNVPAEHRGTFGSGDIWTWTALCADTKLVPTWLVGERTMEDARVFIMDLASRLSNRIQLTSDGLNVTIRAVDEAFGYEGIDYAILHRLYANPSGKAASGRYSPAECIGAERRPVMGFPDPERISTSYVERQNLTMRMGMRRFTRLTNAFSKKMENLAHAVSLHYMHYNFARPHKTLGRGITPAMAAGVVDHR
jgi:IS1 family transposase